MSPTGVKGVIQPEPDSLLGPAILTAACHVNTLERRVNAESQTFACMGLLLFYTRVKGALGYPWV